MTVRVDDRVAEPAVVDDLPAVPDAVAQEELAELQKVARSK